MSQITVEFELDRDVDLAANDVRDRVARARRDLPDEVEEPIVAKRDADASPIMWIALFGARLRPDRDLAPSPRRRSRTASSKLPGVSDVIIAGEQRYSMRVWIDNARLDRAPA